MPGPCKLSRAPGPVNQSFWGRITRQWLWVLYVLYHFTFAAAAISPEGRAESDPEQGLDSRQCAWGAPTPWCDFKPPHTCSFTDRFLEFLHQRSQAITAAEQIEQDEQDENWGADLPVDPPTRARGDLSVLQERGGERHWRFYRPDPFVVGRSLEMDLHVLADHTLEYVEGRIIQHWPALANPLVQWKVVPVHISINVAIYIPEEVEVFLLEVNVDLPFGHVPYMLERQHWDVSRGYFHGYLEPRTRYCAL